MKFQRKSKSEMVICKYPVTLGEFSVTMPTAAVVVAVQLQGEDPQMWACVDPSSPAITRRFKVVATGEDFEPTWHYVGTFQEHRGGLVLHLLEEPSCLDLADVLTALSLFDTKAAVPAVGP